MSDSSHYHTFSVVLYLFWAYKSVVRKKLTENLNVVQNSFLKAYLISSLDLNFIELLWF